MSGPAPWLPSWERTSRRGAAGRPRERLSGPVGPVGEVSRPRGTASQATQTEGGVYRPHKLQKVSFYCPTSSLSGGLRLSLSPQSCLPPSISLGRPVQEKLRLKTGFQCQSQQPWLPDEEEPWGPHPRGPRHLPRSAGFTHPRALWQPGTRGNHACSHSPLGGRVQV